MTGYDNLPSLLAHEPNSWECPDSSMRALANSKTKRIKKEKEGMQGGKTLFAESVRLTTSEFGKLTARYGEKNARRMIEKLSAYKGSTGRHYKSDYRTILNWVAGAVLGTKSQAVPDPVQPDRCPECHIGGGNHALSCSRHHENSGRPA